MKRFFSIITMLYLAFNLNAQNTFKKSDKVLNLGLGLGSTLYAGSGYSSKIPPISASFEVGVKDNLFDEKSSLGIGGYLGYSGAKWEYSGYGWKYSNFIIGVRGNLHYQLIDKFDTYTGLLIGYNIISSKEIGSWPGYTNYSATASGVAWSWFVGGRYYFTDKFAAMAEIGYGIAYLNLGIAYKF